MASSIILFLISVVIGFLFWKFFAGKREGDRLERSIRPKIGPYRLHLHHWIICLVLLFVLLSLDINHPIFLGLLVGSVIQGLLYKDRFVVFYKDKDFEDIYSKFR